MFCLLVVFLALKDFNPKAGATQGLETLKFDFSEHVDTLTTTTLKSLVAFCLFNISAHEPFIFFLFSYIMAQLQKSMEEESGGH